MTTERDAWRQYLLAERARFTEEFRGGPETFDSYCEAQADGMLKAECERFGPLHEREDEAALVLSMGRELRTDADGTTGQSEQWRACARYYLIRYEEVLAEVEESADAGPVNVDANGSEVQS